MDVEIDLKGGALAARAARASVMGLAGFLPPAVIEDVRLLVSELVTNSVRHAGTNELGRMSLRLTSDGVRVRVEVVDGGPGFVPREPDPRLDRASGWGLVLVDRIADRWGVENDGAAKVWFEIDARRVGRRSPKLDKIPA